MSEVARLHLELNALRDMIEDSKVEKQQWLRRRSSLGDKIVGLKAERDRPWTPKALQESDREGLLLQGTSGGSRKVLAQDLDELQVITPV